MEGKHTPYIKHLGKAYHSFAPLVAWQLWLLEATWRKNTHGLHKISWVDLVIFFCRVFVLPKKTYISLEHMLVGRQKPHLVSPFERVTFVHVFFFWGGGKWKVRFWHMLWLVAIQGWSTVFFLSSFPRWPNCWGHIKCVSSVRNRDLKCGRWRILRKPKKVNVT